MLRPSVPDLMADNEWLKGEIARLKREGTPGVMHAVDKAFYDHTVVQRDQAWAEVERLKHDLAKMTSANEVNYNTAKRRGAEIERLRQANLDLDTDLAWEQTK
jgi:hypothetical protein